MTQVEIESVLKDVDRNRRDLNVDQICTEGDVMGSLMDLGISFLLEFGKLNVYY